MRLSGEKVRQEMDTSCRRVRAFIVKSCWGYAGEDG